MKYKAFLSYSHAADNDLAADVQSALHKFAKKWRNFRAIRTFRDTTNLSVTPALWHSITSALDESEFFILLASPEAARSAWVNKEVAYWLHSRPVENPAENFLIIQTSGQLVWNNDPTNPDFDWNQTDALPPILKGVFRQEPRYADLSWATKPEDRSLRSPRFRSAIADLAAPLHGQDKDDLDGEDVRQYKKATHFRQLVFTALLILLFVSLTMSAYAWSQNGLAQQNAREALQNQLKAEASAVLAREKQREAEANLREAEKQTQIAHEERTNAQNQTQIANQQRKVAERQQQIAITNARLAEERQQIAIKQTAEARRKNYLANVAYIMAADENTRVSEFQGLKARLDSVDEPLRSWEWQHLQLKMDNSLLTIDGEEVFRKVTDVAFNRDGTMIVSATDDYTLRVWDARDGKNLLTLLASNNFNQRVKVKKVGFSPDGSRIVAGAEGGTVCVWDAISGERLMVLQHGSRNINHSREVQEVAFSQDGTKIMSRTYEEFRIWDTKTGTLLKYMDITPTDKSFIVAFNPDGSTLVEYDISKEEMRMRDADTARPLVILQGKFNSFSAVGFSKDGKLFAASSPSKSIDVWDVKSGNLKFSLSGHRTQVEDLAFSLSGKRLVSCSYEGLRVWEMETGNQITLLQGHRSTVKAVAFSGDDNLIVSGAEDNTLRTWDVSSAAHISLPQAHNITALAVSRDGKYIAAGERVGPSEEQPRVLIYDAGTLQVRKMLNPLAGNIVKMDFSADGRQLVVIGVNGLARIIDSESGELLGTIKGDHLINAVAFSVDGKYLAIGGRDGYVAVWLAKTLEPIWFVKGHEDIVAQLSFSLDSTHLVSGSWDDSINVWEAGTGKRLNTLKGHDGAVFSVSFSPDGNHVASGSYDSTIKIWDALKSNPPETLSGHTNGVTSAVFSLDGRRIFSASADTTLRLWDTEAKEFITVLRDANPMRDWSVQAGVFNEGVRNANFGIQNLALSSDGTRLVATLMDAGDDRSGDTQSYLMIWNTSLPPRRSTVHARPSVAAPGGSEIASERLTTSTGGNVIAVRRQHPFEIEQWLDRGMTHGLRSLDFIRFARYGWPRDQKWKHELSYEKTLPLEDGSAQSYVRRGQAYLERDDCMLAIADFTEAIRLAPDNPDTFGRRGLAHYFNGELGEALSDINKIISSGAENAESYLLVRGNIYRQTNKFDLALADLDRAVARQPNYEVPLRERGMVYLQMGKFDQATADFSQAIKLAPRTSAFYHYRGMALHQKGDLAGAAKDFEELIRTNPESFEGHYRLACVLFDAGRYDEALSRWEILLKLAPKMSRALAGKAITLDAINEKKQALNLLAVVIAQDDRFWNCAKELKDDYFWAKSGCLAAAPIVQRIRAEFIKMTMQKLGEAPPK